MANPATQETPAAQVQLGFGPGVGPDGRTWGVMITSCGPLSVQVAYPPEALEQICEALPQQLKDLTEHVRRTNMGLVVTPNLEGLDIANIRKRKTK